MRWLALVFALLIVALQYPMWLGKGGWFRVRDLGAQVATQRQTNAGLKSRNDALDAEVRDLKQGVEAIEERARSELGMIRQDEVFFQFPAEAPAASSAPGQPAKRGPAAPDSSRPHGVNEIAPALPPSRE